MSFQRFLVPFYYWETVEIMITGVNYCENGIKVLNAWMCVCAYIYVYIYICVCVCVCVTLSYENMCVHMCLHVHIFICMCVYIYMIEMTVHICKTLRKSFWKLSFYTWGLHHLCTYICIHVYIHMYVNMYMHINVASHSVHIKLKMAYLCVYWHICVLITFKLI